MNDLPPDPDRLRVIRLYLQLQLDAVDAKIREAEGSAPPEPSIVAPPRQQNLPRGRDGWRLQHVPDRGPIKAVLHRGDCTNGAGGWLSRKELDIALGMPEVEPCPRCHPERDRA
ncbi:DUF6233 domain-containing protein [Streptomyces sp. NPDC088732]|uniref:DUF6233 domain-containing protein n=1 Tax=Streptomyces sp. NPDC088732 TaxID=3365879 RepID=UPI0038279212